MGPIEVNSLSFRLAGKALLEKKATQIMETYLGIVEVKDGKILA